MSSKQPVKLTKIQTQKRAGRYNLYFNDEYTFPISEETLIHFQLTKDMELTEQFIQQIKEFEVGSTAYNKALAYLSGQLRTTKEVVQKLKSLEFSEEIIDQVIQQLNTLQLLNDLEYANAYVRTMMRTSDKGPRIIHNNLFQKGISENDIQTALGQYSNDLQLETLQKLVEKNFKKYRRESMRQQIQKTKQNLFAKGFSTDLVGQAISTFDIDDTSELENARVQYEKLNRRYHTLNKSSRNLKIKRSLFTKGYSMDIINQLVDND